jgi:hypothetical protein
MIKEDPPMAAHPDSTASPLDRHSSPVASTTRKDG